MMRFPFCLCLMALVGMLTRPALAQEPGRATPPPQYIFLNRAPGPDWDQNRPASVTDALFTQPLEAVGTRGNGRRRLGLSFILSYLNGTPQTLERTLRRLLALSMKHDVPVLIVLDGENYWDGRPDLWNWWDPAKPGYDPGNRVNVEWTGWGPQEAVKVCWRNWGRQFRVRPAPNLASRRFRQASRQSLTALVTILRQWQDRLPPEKRDLFPGVKIGWEASVGINTYHYSGGNAFLEKYPNDPSHDPTVGLDMKEDFAGGLQPLGYAALTSKGWRHRGPVTLADQEKITTDYLAFLARVCRQAGLPRDQVWTHAGGQYAPWTRHYSHRVAINPDSLPGWSLYGHAPAEAGDLGDSLTQAGLEDWCAAEWLPAVSTAAQWAAAYEETLSFRRCRFLSLYNWEGIRSKPEAVEGLRRALMTGRP
jgi:hypothetical protein